MSDTITITELSDTQTSNIMERKELASIYHHRFTESSQGVGYHNCAGFAKYLIGLSPTDKYVNTSDASPSGLIGHLNQEDILPLSEFEEQAWIEKSQNADVVGFLNHKNGEWRYLHFLVPNPDPDKPFEVFHRNGFEEEEAEISDIRDVLTDEEFRGDTTLVFLKMKDNSAKKQKEVA